jgi:large repetitive protein
VVADSGWWAGGGGGIGATISSANVVTAYNVAYVGKSLHRAGYTGDAVASHPYGGAGGLGGQTAGSDGAAGSLYGGGGGGGAYGTNAVQNSGAGGRGGYGGLLIAYGAGS